MTREAFDILIHRLEAADGAHPERLTLRAAGALILGYLILAAGIAVGLSIALAGIWLLLSSPWSPFGWLSVLLIPTGLGIMVFILVRLWFPVTPPRGIQLDPAQVPELFRLINEAGGSRIHGVLLDGELNASIMQTPRLGLLGWHRTWLVIGLPLMHVLSPDEFRAVLAHEFAHLRGNGAICRWLHRTRSTWEKAMERMDGQTGFLPLGRILGWIWPHFNAPACLLSRMAEFECDRIAAQRTHPETLATGLIRLAIHSRRSEEIFWRDLSSEIRHHRTPPDDVIQRLRDFLKEPLEPDLVSRLLRQTLQAATDGRDSHPGLSARLEKLGYRPHGDTTVFQSLPDPSAADSLLPPSFLADAETSLSGIWREAARERWQHEHTETLSHDRKNRHQVRTVRESWERIAALTRVDGLERMQPEIIALLERKPDHAGALYLRGCYLAQIEDSTAIGFLERAANDPTIAGRAFEALSEFHRRAGRTDEITILKRRADQHERELRLALIERSRTSRNDTFASPELDESTVEALRAILSARTQVKRAWLVAKHVHHFPHWRHFILILDIRWPTHTRTRDREQALAGIVDEWEVDGYVRALSDGPETRSITRTIRRLVPDCEVYRKA